MNKCNPCLKRSVWLTFNEVQAQGQLKSSCSIRYDYAVWDPSAEPLGNESFESGIH